MYFGQLYQLFDAFLNKVKNEESIFVFYVYMDSELYMVI